MITVAALMGNKPLLGNEEGSATITAAGIAGALVMITLMIIYIVATTIDAHRAQVAADLAAVAAAEALYEGADACHTATIVTGYNQADLTDCRIDGADVIVQATVRAATVQAKAGPL
jgi:hypothetical protein